MTLMTGAATSRVTVSASTGTKTEMHQTNANNARYAPTDAATKITNASRQAMSGCIRFTSLPNVKDEPRPCAARLLRKQEA